MPDYQHIYRTGARQYHALVAREDYEGRLLPALERIRPLVGLDVAEWGTGTGRLTNLLVPWVRQILAVDISPPMLQVAAENLHRSGRHNWRLAVADNRQMPAASHSADLAIAGWTLGHFCAWYPHTWQEEIGRALAEMTRVVRPEGTAVIIETLGTGRESPAPPTEALAAYYRWLEQEHNFTQHWVRTDYRFASHAEAQELTRFFFGEELARYVGREELVTLPECTGIWCKTT